MNAMHALTTCYTEPHRRYHTLEHIAHMFNVAREHNIQLSNEQIAAIWWHDAVYVPRSPNNEFESAQLMCAYVSSGEHFVETCSMILDTMHHIPKSNKSAVVCDLDMFGFAESTHVRNRINKQLETEFIISGLSPQDYRAGRIKFLNDLLSKPIFHSAQFVEYNNLAHENIAADIKRLQHE